MKPVNSRIRTSLVILILMLNSSIASAQQKDTDALLKAALSDFKNKDYDAALKKSNDGIKLAPDYLDFFIIAGRVSMVQKNYDNARYYFNYVIAKDQRYEDAYSYLITTEIADGKLEKAREADEKAIIAYPKNVEFRIKKMEIYQIRRDERSEFRYVSELRETFPGNEKIEQRYRALSFKFDSDRIGADYSFTTFNRDNYGPWHLGSLQYIGDRKWGSVIGRISYANRLSDGETVADGLQYEAETYLYQGKTDYHYGGIAYSDATAFPHWRVGYSYFHTFGSGWEGDLGFRFTEAGNREFKTGVIGIGKYAGSNWIQLRAYIQTETSDLYPAFVLTARHYFDTRFDYLQFIAGYGTSPDDRTALGQFDQRVALNSYRFGAGYYRFLGHHFVTGIMGTFNRQEYAPGLQQNELELSLTLHYKF